MPILLVRVRPKRARNFAPTSVVARARRGIFAVATILVVRQVDNSIVVSISLIIWLGDRKSVEMITTASPDRARGGREGELYPVIRFAGR